MRGQSAAVAPPSGARFMVVFGAVVVVLIGLYFLFMAVDSLGLADQEGTATVLGKEFREASTTYQTQKVGDRMLTVPQVTPPMYILKLNIAGRKTEGPVDKSLYDAVVAGDRVRVVYQKRRILGQVQIVSVTR